MTGTVAPIDNPFPDATIGFIGGGNMARAMIGGLVENGVDPNFIRVADPDAKQRQALQDAFPGVGSGDDNRALVGCDVCVLAVKPQLMKSVCTALADASGAQSTLFVSIAAGIRNGDIDAWLGGGRAVVRAMPNQGALIGRSATGVHANSQCDATQRALADHVISAMGQVFWFDDEADIDSVTAVAGSGPAYFFLLMEMLHASARRFGLPDPTARELVVATAAAAAGLAARPDSDLAELRANVTSKGGTTAAAIDYLLEQDIQTTFHAALSAARDRAAALADGATNDQGKPC